MGNALIMTTVPEEMLGVGALRYRDENGNVVSLTKPGEWLTGKQREQALRDHPNAFWMLAVPVSAVWKPPPEPFRQYGPDWHFDSERLGEHRERVRQSLEQFVNTHLAGLDHMLRTGWFIIERARAVISELGEVPHRPDETPRRGS